ncbi:TadE/TadG family type IV pilus assembly protein [Metapseudomonas boanensis]|uniref:Pilus assembly protein n=1 Tax=Metapseudomonas boanensis TaxID=2822138 RepID=A0ABS5XF90_9GAMM|nr:TadE/TadG family type IV pilus assembly protein [Pseudomonas boanensis]MBT8766347.1 pilus assembly protein [Pseudomonas boanensis]
MGKKRMQGLYTVEFALVGLVLFVLLFGVLEMGRLYFTVNALNEVVRRGARLAAVCTVTDEDIRQRAIFNAAGTGGVGESQLVRGLETADVKLSYLDENGLPVSAPSTTDFSKIRYVRLVIDQFSFSLLIPGFGGGVTLPTFRAILPRESLGYDGATEVPTRC